MGSHGSQQDWASRKPQPEWQGPTAADWQAPVGAGDEAPALLGLAPPEARADVPVAAAQPPLPRSMPCVLFLCTSMVMQCFDVRFASN